MLFPDIFMRKSILLPTHQGLSTGHNPICSARQAARQISRLPMKRAAVSISLHWPLTPSATQLIIIISSSGLARVGIICMLSPFGRPFRLSAVVLSSRASLRSSPPLSSKHPNPIDFHWISLWYLTFKRWPLDTYRISCAYWEGQYSPLISHPFFAPIHFGAIAILGLAAPTYFGAIDSTIYVWQMGKLMKSNMIQWIWLE